MNKNHIVQRGNASENYKNDAHKQKILCEYQIEYISNKSCLYYNICIKSFKIYYNFFYSIPILKIQMRLNVFTIK